MIIKLIQHLTNKTGSQSYHGGDDKRRFIALDRPCQTCPELNLFFIFWSRSKKDVDEEEERVCGIVYTCVRVFMCVGVCACVRV